MKSTYAHLLLSPRLFFDFSILVPIPTINEKYNSDTGGVRDVLSFRIRICWPWPHKRQKAPKRNKKKKMDRTPPSHGLSWTEFRLQNIGPHRLQRISLLYNQMQWDCGLLFRVWHCLGLKIRFTTCWSTIWWSSTISYEVFYFYKYKRYC